jgi:hypothetical protein
MNASPVIQAGIDRPDMKNSWLEVVVRLSANPIPSTNRK